MIIHWLTDSMIHLSLLSKRMNSDKIKMLSVDEDMLPAADRHVLIIYANAGSGRRTLRLGLRWLQRFRRETRSTAPSIIYSFEPRDLLARKFSMLDVTSPGTDFLRLPFTSADLKKLLESIEPLTPSQLDELLRWH